MNTLNPTGPQTASSDRPPTQWYSPRHWVGLVFLTGVVFCFGLARSSAAQTDRAIRLTVTPGLDGYCRAGTWFPVRLTLQNDGPDLEGVVQIVVPEGDSGGTRFAQNVGLPQHSLKEIRLNIFPRGTLSNLEAVLLVGSEVVAATPFRVTCLGASELLYGLLSDQPSGFNRLLDSGLTSGKAFIARLQTSDLPDHFQALQPLSLLIISDTDTSNLTRNQQGALQLWVASGGHLVVAAGPDWQKTTAGLQDILPLDPSKTQTVPDLNPLALLVGDDTSLSGEALTSQGKLHPDAEILAGWNGTPLLTQAPFGAGKVTYLHANPSLAPLDSWTAFPELVRYLDDFQEPGTQTAWLGGFQPGINANNVFSSVPGLDIPSINLICGTLLMYILAVGPANYLVLRRWGRREFAWISIPVLVLLFSGFAYLFGVRTRGEKAILTRLNVVQSWPDIAISRIDGLAGLFSPTRKIYELEFQGNLLAQASPPPFGGYNFNWLFMQDPDALLIKDLPMDIGSLETFSYTGSYPPLSVSHDLRIDLDPASSGLRGTLRLESGPDLEDAVLITPQGIVHLGTIFSGRSYPVNFPFEVVTPASGIFQTPPGTLDSLNLIEQIIGMPYISGQQEVGLKRRVDLLTGFLSTESETAGLPPDFYLAGWSEAGLPIQPSSTSGQIRIEDLTFYLIELPIPYLTDQPRITIPSWLYRWTVTDPGLVAAPGQEPGPYHAQLPPGTHFEVRYRLSQPVDYDRVDSLLMRIESDQNLVPPPGISLWKFKAEKWVSQPLRRWGIHSIDYPADYIGNNGEIRVRVDIGLDQTEVYLRSLDFTLGVETGEP